jgi:mannose-1-phosphate guanylyltransferase/mannose-6-phosphate isomerase
MAGAPNIISIIMAGGSGTRLWPSSRSSAPKQFLKLLGKESFIQMTARRLASICGEENVFVVSDEPHRFTVKNQITEVFSKPFNRLILEPEGRNTAPAIALSLRFMLDQGAQDDDVLFFSPSDHLIRPESSFCKSLLEALPWAKEHIITFGIIPSRAETGYGYIETGDAHRESAPFQVRTFREKPDIETARRFVESGKFLWNSGMFMFSVGVIRNAFKHHAPTLSRAIEEMDFKKMAAHYASLPRESIDYAIMEKADNILCLPLDIEWSDIGSWDSIYQTLPHDDAGNASAGSVHIMESTDCLVMAENRLISLLGVTDLAVIDTADALLICRRSESQRVKELVEALSRINPPITETHTTTHRPWGNFTVLKEGPQYKIKHFTVNPGAHLSLQTHNKRSEHWVVIAGTAEVTVGGEKRILKKNESAYVPIAVPHRLANPGEQPLEIIEVQNGWYVGEDDITRLDDVYGRD